MNILQYQVPDVAGVHRHRALQLDVSDSTCDFEFGFGNPGPLSDATPIGPCAPPGDQCPHEPCVPAYLQGDATGPSTFTEFVPNYQVTSRSSDLAFGPLPGSAIIDIETLPVWNGCHRDRTDANPVALALAILQGLKFIPKTIEAVCEGKRDFWSLASWSLARARCSAHRQFVPYFVNSSFIACTSDTISNGR